jgi:iron complex transport system substrate-binding protein
MLLRSVAVRMMAALTVLFVTPGPVFGFVDSAGRYVVLPQPIGRVIGANPAADVLVFVLAPEKLAGWSAPLSRGQRAYLPAKFARLPAVGGLIRPNLAEAAQVVLRMHPDLVVEAGPISPEAAARADWLQQQTGVPYIVIDNSIQTIPTALRIIGTVLGAAQRGDDLAKYADYAIDAVRGRLLIAPADDRPLVYYGRGPDGLETGLAGSQAMADIDQAGVINVASSLGSGQLTRVTREQLLASSPAIIIAQDRSFYNSLMRDSTWRSLKAVADKRVYLAPADPFGWIDDPPGVNRIIGLYWLTGLFYPDQYQEDLRSNVSEFYEKFYSVKLSDRQLDALLRPAIGTSTTTGSQVGVPLLGAEPVPIPNTSPNAPAPLGRPPGRGGVGMPNQSNPTGVPGNPQ